MSLEQHLDTIEARVGPETRVVVFRVKRARNPDAVGMTLMEGCIHRLHARGVQVLMCGVRRGFFACMKRCGLVPQLGEPNIFLEQPVRQTSTLLAIRHACELVSEPCPTCPRRQVAADGRGMYYEP
jgi:SulP family sulfate permease